MMLLILRRRANPLLYSLQVKKKIDGDYSSSDIPQPSHKSQGFQGFRDLII